MTVTLTRTMTITVLSIECSYITDTVPSNSCALVHLVLKPAPWCRPMSFQVQGWGRWWTGQRCSETSILFPCPGVLWLELGSHSFFLGNSSLSCMWQNVLFAINSSKKQFVVMWLLHNRAIFLSQFLQLVSKLLKVTENFAFMKSESKGSLLPDI